MSHRLPTCVTVCRFIFKPEYDHFVRAALVAGLSPFSRVIHPKTGLRSKPKNFA
jgi:hypothetical protein